MSLIRRLTLRQLQIFSVAARHVSFARTAEELHLSPPAVSMQLRQLEETAGLPLFERLGRGLALTEAGQKLAYHIQRIMGQIKDAEADLQTLISADEGVVSVGIVSTAQYFMPKLLARFSSQNPGVEVQFSVGNRDMLIAMLQENSIDFAVTGRPPKGMEVEAEPLAHHPYVMIASPGHKLSLSPCLDLKKLRKETLLLREVGSGSRSVAEEMFKAHAFTPVRQVTLGSNETVKQAVIAGMGVSLISLHTLALELKLGELALLDVLGTPIDRAWHVVHMQSKRLSPACQKFRQYLLENTVPHLEREYGWINTLKQGLSTKPPVGKSDGRGERRTKASKQGRKKH